MEAKDLIKELYLFLKNNDIGISFYEFVRDNYNSESEPELKERFGDFQEIFASRLDDHETYQRVWYFKDHDCYLAVCGYYSSWEGTNFDDAKLYHVVPMEITKTVYRSPNC